MKPFHWTKLTNFQANGTVWSKMGSEFEVGPLMSEIENLFCIAEAPPKETISPTTEEMPTGIPKPKKVVLLSDKRHNNCAILLTRFKRFTLEQLKQALIKMEKHSLSEEDVASLIEFVPQPDEIETLMNYKNSGSDLSVLGEPEKFFLLMSEVRGLEARLKSFLFTMKCDNVFNDLTPDIEVVIKACKELTSSKKFMSLLSLILSLGNYINAGGFRFFSLFFIFYYFFIFILLLYLFYFNLYFYFYIFLFLFLFLFLYFFFYFCKIEVLLLVFVSTHWPS